MTATVDDATKTSGGPHAALARSLLLQVLALNRGVESKDTRALSRALRTVPKLRASWRQDPTLGAVLFSLTRFLHESSSSASSTPLVSPVPAVAAVALQHPLSSLPDGLNQLSLFTFSVGVSKTVPAPAATSAADTSASVITLSDPVPSVLSLEASVYLDLLYGLFVLDRVRSLPAPGVASRYFSALLQLVSAHNRRTLDLLSAKVYYYYALSGELDRCVSVRELLASHRRACLQHNQIGQAVLINAVLRAHIIAHQYELADTFRTKTLYPEDLRLIPGPIYARYCFYQGKIQVVQLAYSDAHASLQLARRKVGAARASGALALTHAIDVHFILTQLLMGDIPERAAFNTRNLTPYLELTRAVRAGDLATFHAMIAKHAAVFHTDDVSSLIARLRHTVIKTGLRAINLSYSRIQLDEMTRKLALEDSFKQDGEQLVVKAIADGVIDATMNHETRSLIARVDEQKPLDTQAPQLAFHRRIALALEIHNDAMRNLAYPATHTGATLGREEDDDSDDEDSVYAAQRRERKMKQKEKERKEKKEQKEKEEKEKKEGGGDEKKKEK